MRSVSVVASSSSGSAAAQQRARVGIRGAFFLVVCATVTTISAVRAEIHGYEPSLRGLVHVGVMLLFAGICMEPVWWKTDHESSGSGGDANGMAIIFAGLGMFFGTAVGLLQLSVWVLTQLDKESRTLIQQERSVTIITLFGTFLFSTLLYRLVFRAVVFPAGDGAVVSVSGMSFAGSISSLILFSMGSVISLLDTWCPIFFHHAGHNHTDGSSSKQSMVPTDILILDLMAHVFHRAFIGSILVGAGFGSNNTDDESLLSSRFFLRARYRTYFLLVATNLAISWCLCGQYWAGILVGMAGMIQWQNASLLIQCLHIAPTPSSHRGGGTSLVRLLVVGWWEDLSLLGSRFSNLCYAGTLFMDGVLSTPPEDSTGSSSFGMLGFDSCLVKAVHVAAVFAAMVAIFPRLLLPMSSTPTSHHRESNNWNRIVKGMVAFMSTMDCIICACILTTMAPSVSSTSRRHVLVARMIGAMLQAATFSRIHRSTASTTMSDSSTDHSKTITTPASNEGMRANVPVDDDLAPLTVPEPATLPTAALDDSASHSRSVDAMGALVWSIYFGTHVIHSLVTPAVSGHSAVAEVQLSKLFHFQVVTIGFYSSGMILPKEDTMSLTIVMIFTLLEALGILTCSGNIAITVDQILIGLASLLMCGDCAYRLIRMTYDAVPVFENESTKRPHGGTTAMLFES